MWPFPGSLQFLRFRVAFNQVLEYVALPGNSQYLLFQPEFGASDLARQLAVPELWKLVQNRA